ncbi:MAG: diguanylate cyclase domain-containing protein [Planctomycetota bacterium]
MSLRSAGLIEADGVCQALVDEAARVISEVIMGDGLRTIRLVTTDESLIASARAAAKTMEGWEVESVTSTRELLVLPPAMGDVVLLDSWLRGVNVYEACRSLTGNTRCRTFLVVEQGNALAEPIARFCGATGVLYRPLVPSRMREALERSGPGRPEIARERRGSESDEPVLPQDLLTDLAGIPDVGLVTALTDPETSLFNFAFLNYKLDEEYKRARRFGQPLSCVMLGFEGQVSEQVLRELSSVFLEASRDTDILGRFDETSFLFLLPNTGPDGASVMARRVGELATERGLIDLVGDPVVISVGIAGCPHSEVRKREDLYNRARQAFLRARQEGGTVVCA